MSTSNFNHKAGKMRSVATELAALAAALLTVLVVMELVLRMFHNFGLNGPDKLHLRDAQGTEIYYGMPWRKTEFRQVTRTNRMGLAAPEFSARDKEEVRVGVYGSSMVEARHLPFADNFVGQADRELPGVQLLPIGKGGYTAAVWLPYFIARYDQYFGPGRAYPALDAVVVALGEQDYTDIFYAEHELGRRRPGLSWQVRCKRPLTKPVADYFKERTRSVFSSVSLIGQKLYDWLWADYRNTFAEPTAADDAWLKRTMRDEVLRRWQTTARQRGLPLGVLYIGNIRDYEAYQQGSVSEWRQLTRAACAELGLPFTDGTTYYQGAAADLFFSADGHPTVLGYRYNAEALRDLIRGKMGSLLKEH